MDQGVGRKHLEWARAKVFGKKSACKLFETLVNIFVEAK